jgi:hypothetical protein
MAGEWPDKAKYKEALKLVGIRAKKTNATDENGDLSKLAYYLRGLQLNLEALGHVSKDFKRFRPTSNPHVEAMCDVDREVSILIYQLSQVCVEAGEVVTKAGQALEVIYGVQQSRFAARGRGEPIPAVGYAVSPTPKKCLPVRRHG